MIFIGIVLTRARFFTACVTFYFSCGRIFLFNTPSFLFATALARAVTLPLAFLAAFTTCVLAILVPFLSPVVSKSATPSPSIDVAMGIFGYLYIGIFPDPPTNGVIIPTDLVLVV